MKLVKSLKSGNSFTWTFVKKDDCHIYVYKFLEEQCIVFLADEKAIKDMTVTTDIGSQDSSSENWNLWLATGSGRLYHIDESKLNQKASSPSNAAGSEAMEVDEAHDIFGDLLATQAAGLSAESRSDQRVIILRHSHAVCKLANEVLSLCSVRDLLFVAHYNDEQYYSIVGYRRLEVLSHTARDDLKFIVKYEAPYKSCRKSPLNSTEHISMYCIESNVQIQDMHNSETVTVSATLFGHLFGPDASLMNSAILLFALPNGIVHFFILKSISTGTSSNILHTKFPDILCDNKSRVVDVHSLCLQSSTTSQSTAALDFSMICNMDKVDDVTNQGDVPKLQEPNVLLIVSQSGRCVLIQESGAAVPHYHTIHLVDAVKCTLSNGHELFCSFTHGVQRVLFETSVDVYNTLSWWPHYRNWNTAGIEGMSFVSQQMDGGGDNDIHPSVLLCCNHSGGIFTIDSSVPRDITRAGQQTSGQKMKDLLTSISNTSSKIDVVHKELERLQKILSQISIACHMYAGYMPSADGIAVAAKFVSCDTCVKCMVHGSNRREYQIVCKITNVSKAVLSADWACVVQCMRYQDLERKHVKDTHSKILSLSQEFRPGAWEDIVIPVNTEHLQCPIFTVSTSLLYHVGAAVNRDCMASSHEPLLDFATHVLTIPLNETRIDLIHFISDQMIGISSHSLNTHNVLAVLPSSDVSHISTSDLIMSMARHRPAYVFHQEKMKTHLQHSKSQDIHTLTVRMPDLINRHVKYPLLRVLLSASQLAASTLSESSIKLLTPNGNYVQLELGTDNTLTLRSTDTLSLVQLHHALVTRIENLKQSSSEVSRPVPTDKSRNCFEKIQTLQQSLADIMQVAAAKAPADRAEYVLLHGLKIYHRLRDIDLV